MARSLNFRPPVAETFAVNGQYRQITPEQRADHVGNLYLLGQLVIRLPVQLAMRRSFYVMSVPHA
jgi:hypothetical protein